MHELNMYKPQTSLNDFNPVPNKHPKPTRNKLKPTPIANPQETLWTNPKQAPQSNHREIKKTYRDLQPTSNRHFKPNLNSKNTLAYDKLTKKTST